MRLAETADCGSIHFIEKIHRERDNERARERERERGRKVEARADHG